MTSILLHEYVEQVEKLIDANRLVEAVEHCRHILHHYPRHIDTYRVMGKALLEKHDYNAATDLFLRILGADPNDFISHVGLSIIYKEESQYDQALWHLERAYEIQPYNVAIQGELRQLYAVETETRPGIIPLTRGALARLYMKGELYQQAIAELRRILADEPERMDLQVLLAEALWRDQHRIDAEEVCLKVLEELPNCVVLNAILAEIWLQTGRAPEAQKYLHRLHGLTWQTQKTLNRESIAGKAFTIDGAFTLPTDASLEFLETGTAIPSEPPAPTDDWVGEVTFDDALADEDSSAEVVLEPESGMHSYDWLADIGELQGAENAENEQASETDWFSQNQAKEALNLSTSELNAEWLADLRGETGEPNEEDESGFQPLDLAAPSGIVSTDDATDWFSDDEEGSPDELFAELDDTAVSPADDTAVDTDHEWLNTLAQEETDQKRGSSALQIDATNLMDDTLMDWDEVESESHIVQEPKTPFWLSQMSEDDLEAVELNPEDALDWLSEEVDAGTAESEITHESAQNDDDQLVSELEWSELDDSLDWLNDVPDEPIAAEALADDLDAEIEESFGPTAVLDPEEQSALPETINLDDTDSLGDADDWLAALTEGTLEEENAWDDNAHEHESSELQVEANTDELAALSDADDWLESASADLDAILEFDASKDDEFPNLTLPDMEGEEITDIPDWLHAENLEQSDNAETAMSSENDPQEKPQPEEPNMDLPEMADDDPESDPLDWLSDLVAEPGEDGEVPADPPIATEGMPSWLSAPEQAADVGVVDEWDSESANIPDWLQEPVELSDLDDDALLGDAEQPEASGLTGLLSEMELPEDEALGLDEMDSLFSDWVDEDADGSLTELLGEFDLNDSLMDQANSFDAADIVEDTAVSPKDDVPEEIGLTGLLSNLSLEDELPPDDSTEEEDFFSGLLVDVDDDDLSDFLVDDTVEPQQKADDAVGLDELDLENMSLTAMLSDLPVDDDPTDDLASFSDDDWLADLDYQTDDADMQDTVADEEEAIGLTGMLANLWPDEDAAAADEHLGESPVSFADDADLAESRVDELGLTELLAGIDYPQEIIDSRPELPDLGDPVEPSLTEILSDMELEPEDDEELADFAPISAEDTTWLSQLEADTGALQAQADEFDMAEESGLDWLTMPDEPEDEEPTAVAEMAATIDEPRVVAEPDSTPEDWDDAMSWLEELAAQQEDPVSELPSVAENMLDEELDTDEALKVTTPMASDNIDWLDDLGDASDALSDEQLEEDFEEIAALADTDVMADAMSEPDEADFEEMLDTWQGDSGLSWLDELATDMLPETAVDNTQFPTDDEDADPVAPIDEAETLVEAEEADAQDDFAADWLNDMVSEDEDTLAEMDLFGEVMDELEMAETAVDQSDLGWLDTVIDDIDEEGDDLDDLVEEATLHSTDTIDAVDDLLDTDEIHRVTGVTDALRADDGIEEAEADLEEALAWLDELDASEGEELEDAELPDEAPPTLVTPAEPHDFPEDDAGDEVPETIVLAPEPDALTQALDRLEQQVRNEGIAVPETAVFPGALSDDDLLAALDWIEQEDQQAEMETAVAEPEAADQLTLTDNSTLEDDPEAWLEELLSGDADLDIDMAPPPIKPSDDAMFVTDDAAAQPEEEPAAEIESETADSLLDDLQIEEMPEDPDAAVAWLDQLVSGDEALDIEMEPPPIKPSDDAMFVTDAVPEIETAVSEPEETLATAQPSMEDDPEAWLEQLLSGGADLDIDMAPPPIKPSEDAMFVTEDAAQTKAEPESEVAEPVAEAPEPELPDLADEDSDEESDLEIATEISMEDDPEAWLEQMLSGDADLDIDMAPPPIKPSEDAMFVTEDAARSADEPTTIAAENALETHPEDAADDIIAEVPDDPDEAMAWLEQLAARQGADLAELPSVANVTDEPEMPDWMVEDLNEVETDEVETIEETTPETAESFTETGDLVDADVDSELPDWLNSGDNRPVVGETDWLHSLPEVDMDSWLSAEEEATTAAPAEEVELPDTGPLRSRPVIESEPLVDDDLFEPVVEPSSGAYNVDETKLSVAQTALADGRIQDALAQFKEMVAEGSGMMAIIAELEQAADAHPQVPALFQVLGDAYMRNGQLQKALASYRSALNQM